ncbi:ABC transporter substrate-binding protein [Robinsoniella peoriensis]|uniref:ABC transporter substrate-binding protein n=1 Tax=Robinsoniella peoriensis TaxID=180332 RepID=UPI00364472BF
MRKKLVGMLLAISMTAAALSGCGGSGNAKETTGTMKESSSDTAANEITDKAAENKAVDKDIEMVLMIENPEVPVTSEVVKKVQEKFPEIKFISKTWDQSQIEKSVKTAFAAGEAVDIVQYWPNQMKNFTTSDMALDLTPYLDSDQDWKNTWVEGALEVGVFDDKNVAVPFGTVYPLLQVNTDIMKKAGVEVKDQWTWDELVDACEKIKENTDAFPLGVKSDNACWFVRNGLMQCWDNQDELDRFNTGEISFTDSRVKEVFDKIKDLYDKSYLYPGEGAVSATQDQITAAFAQGQVAMFANTNNQCGIAKEAANGAFDVEIVSWPNMGKADMNYLLGGSDGFFITENTKNPDKAVEVLKYLTSTEILQMYADTGNVVPVKGIASADPDYQLYGVDAAKVYPTEPIGISPEMFDYIVYNTPSNYLFYGDTCLDELEALRTAAVGK